MKVLVAPNALKGSLTAARAAAIIAQSLPDGWESTPCPIADGGDGTLDCLVNATGGRFFNASVTGPFRDMKVNARWGTLGSERTAVIEMAEAAGLRLLKPEQYSAGRTTTYGVGELILKTIEAGFRKILVGLGGSATNDGGTGCVAALGVRFLDGRGKRLAPGGIHLRDLQKIDLTQLDKRVRECEFVCLADVNIPLSGSTGTTKLFARQKGATAEEIRHLDNAMSHYSHLLLRQLNVDADKMPGSGAAGGFGAGLTAFCNARIVPGIDYILDLLRFDEMLGKCDAVVTAEGSLDGQTGLGKGIAGVALRAAKRRIPVHVFAGRVKGDPLYLSHQLGVDSIHEISPATTNDHEAMKRAEELLSTAVKNAAAGW